MPRIICFNNEELRLNALDELTAIHADEEIRTIKERAEQRRERREQNRQDRAANEADPDDKGDDAPASDASSAESQDREDRPDWTRVDLLSYGREDVGRFIERGDIDAEDVKVRTDRHDWLILE